MCWLLAVEISIREKNDNSRLSAVWKQLGHLLGFSLFHIELCASPASQTFPAKMFVEDTGRW